MKYKRKDGKLFKIMSFFVCPKCSKRLYSQDFNLVCKQCDYRIDYKEIPTRRELSKMTVSK